MNIKEQQQKAVQDMPKLTRSEWITLDEYARLLLGSGGSRGGRVTRSGKRLNK